MLAIIPARLNSKRIKKKNIKLFKGKPMISYAINKAIKSNLFNKIIVSTESDQIASIAREAGADVPFLRSEDLADDYTTTKKVIEHSISTCDEFGYEFDYVCCIYPCVPLLKVEDLINSSTLLKDNEDKFIFPVARYSSPIQRALKKKPSGVISAFMPQFEDCRTQDIEESYYDPGQFYWGHKKIWRTQKSVHNNGLGYEIPSWRAVDIDNAEDWERAEILYKLVN